MSRRDDEQTGTQTAIMRAVQLSPTRKVQIQAGALWTAGTVIVGCAITCTAYVVRMEGKVDRALEGVESINKTMETMAPQHAILWDCYTRTAFRGNGQRGNP